MSPNSLKAVLAPFRAAQRNFDLDNVRTVLENASHPDATFRLAYPFEDKVGAKDFVDHAYRGLLAAWPDLERRDWIVTAGRTEQGNDWVGCAGHYVGTFQNSWMGIPATGRAASIRFHEFYEIVDGRIAEMQAIWDVPEVMMQAGAWPLSPSLGREWLVPGPMTCDGLSISDAQGQGEKSLALVIEMLTAMGRHPKEPVEAMELPRFWDERVNWYGPAGIGTARGIDGFRRHHQIPFLNAMPDRGQYKDLLNYHFFGEGNYVAVTGWPNMKQTLSADGWLGLPPTGKKIDLCSLDFWRLEQSADGQMRIRENWVLVDLLNVYRQLDVDVMARMREMVG